MSSVRIACIVEGHGEVDALPVLLRRIAQIQNPDLYLDIVATLREKKSRLLQPGGIERSLSLARQRGCMLLILSVGCAAYLPTLARRMIWKQSVGPKSGSTISCPKVIVKRLIKRL